MNVQENTITNSSHGVKTFIAEAFNSKSKLAYQFFYTLNDNKTLTRSTAWVLINGKQYDLIARNNEWTKVGKSTMPYAITELIQFVEDNIDYEVAV